MQGEASVPIPFGQGRSGHRLDQIPDKLFAERLERVVPVLPRKLELASRQVQKRFVGLFRVLLQGVGPCLQQEIDRLETFAVLFFFFGGYDDYVDR